MNGRIHDESTTIPKEGGQTALKDRPFAVGVDWWVCPYTIWSNQEPVWAGSVWAKNLGQLNYMWVIR